MCVCACPMAKKHDGRKADDNLRQKRRGYETGEMMRTTKEQKRDKEQRMREIKVNSRIKTKELHTSEWLH